MYLSKSACKKFLAHVYNAFFMTLPLAVLGNSAKTPSCPKKPNLARRVLDTRNLIEDHDILVGLYSLSPNSGRLRGSAPRPYL